MPDQHALRHDEKWNAICCDLDICLDAGGTPVGFTTYGKGEESVTTAPSVMATTHRAFTSASKLRTSHGHEGGVRRGAKVPGYCGICYPLEWVDSVRADGNPMVVDGCLIALNDGNCVGYAESSRACWNEVVVFDNATDDGHDNVEENCRDMASRRNAPFFESDDSTSIDGQAGKVTTCGHRTDPASRNPMRSGHYQEILGGLESRGLEIGNDVEINSCGGLGDHRPYVGSEPYDSDKLCQDLSGTTGKHVKVYKELVLQKSGPKGETLSKRGYLDWLITGRKTKNAPSIECSP